MLRFQTALRTHSLGVYWVRISLRSSLRTITIIQTEGHPCSEPVLDVISRDILEISVEQLDRIAESARALAAAEYH